MMRSEYFRSFSIKLRRFLVHARWALADLWFDIKYWNRETLYTRGTRHDIQARLRRDLMDPVGNKDIQQIANACWEDNHLRRIFRRYAVKSPQSGRDVWTQASFDVFITEQFHHDSADLIASLATVLWRNFCFSAVYPFADDSKDPSTQIVGFEGWLQAVAFLATDAGGNIRNNRSSAIYLYWSDQSSAWLRFASSLSDPQQRVSALVSGAAVSGTENAPHGMMHQIARVVRSQPTMMYVHVQPDLAVIQPKIERLRGDMDVARMPIEEFTIPYKELLSLLVAILQIDKRHPDYFTWQLRCEPVLLPISDVHVHLSIARAILQGAGIRENGPVTFDQFWSLFEYTTRKDQSGGLNQDTQHLWRALFLGEHYAEPATSSRPCAMISQTLDLLLPLKQDSRARHARHTSKLLFTSSVRTRDSFEGLVKDLLRSYDQVFAIIQGVTLDSSTAQIGEPAVFAIMSTAPFWTAGKLGQHVSEVCHTGDCHLLVDLTPQPRALWYNHGRTLYKDLIRVNQDRGFSYGCPVEDVDGTSRFSGLKFDLRTNTATLCSDPLQSEKNYREYIEIELDQGFPKRVKVPKTWKTEIQVEKVEVFRYKEGIPQLEGK